jgi:RNA polymerase sigma-70 factor (ECF subfamily)
MDDRELPRPDVGGLDGADSPEAIALGRLFALYFEDLYRFAYRYVRSVETAKDLVDEAFLRLWLHRSEVELGGRSARSYLYTTVRYQALDSLRRRSVEDRWRMEYAAPRVQGDERALARDPDQELADRETAAAIQQAVDTLPPRQRQVLLLRWQQQASYDQIAASLGISAKTVAVHLGRAIQRLREILAQAR